MNRTRFFLVPMAALVCCAALAQLPIESLQLRGNRFRGLSYQEMTPAQRAMLDHTVNSARAVTNTTANGPFNVLLRSPEIGDLSQQLGNQLRFNSGLSGKLRELATLMAGRAWSSKYEWYAHARYAKDEGIAPAVIDAIARHKAQPEAEMDAEERVVWRVADEILYTRQLSEATFQQAMKTLGEKRLFGVVALVAYYEYVSMILNVDGYPLPADAPPGVEKALEPLDQLFRNTAQPRAHGFTKLPLAELTGAQRAVAQNGHGNYQALLSNPELAQAIEAFGRAVKGAGLGPQVMAAVTNHWRVSDFLWGSSNGKPLVDADFAAELLSHREVSDKTFNAARDQLGERGLVNLIMLIGYANITCATSTLAGEVCRF